MRKPRTLTAATTGAGSTRDRILDAAARIFREKGYADTTMNDFADATNMKAASIYYHFKSKDEIVEEVLNEGTVRVFRAAKNAVDCSPDGATSKERIEIAIREHLNALHLESDFTAANVRIFPEAPADVVKRHMCNRRAYSRFWIDLINEGKRSGEIDESVNADMTHMFIVGAMNWSTQWYSPKTHRVREMSDAVISLITSGLFQSET